MNKTLNSLVEGIARELEPELTVTDEQVEEAIRCEADKMSRDAAFWVQTVETDRDPVTKEICILIAQGLRRADADGVFEMPLEVKQFLDGLNA